MPLYCMAPPCHGICSDTTIALLGHKAKSLTVAVCCVFLWREASPAGPGAGLPLAGFAALVLARRQRRRRPPPQEAERRRSGLRAGRRAAETGADLLVGRFASFVSFALADWREGDSVLYALCCLWLSRRLRGGGANASSRRLSGRACACFVFRAYKGAPGIV